MNGGFWAQVGWVEVVLAVIVAGSLLRGAVRGVFPAFFGAAAVAGGLLAARDFWHAALPLVGGAPFWAAAVVFVGVFAAVSGVGGAVCFVLRRWELGEWGRGGGSFFGLLRGGLLAAVFVLCGSALALNETEGWRGSPAVAAVGTVLDFALPAEASARRWLRFDAESRPVVAGAAAGMAVRAAGELDAVAAVVRRAMVVERGREGAGAGLDELVSEVSALQGRETAVLDEVLGELREVTSVRTEYHEDFVREAEAQAAIAERAAGYGRRQALAGEIARQVICGLKEEECGEAGADGAEEGR